MKKTQFYELKSNVKATLTSFISLTMFVLLGFGIFLGFSWISDALHASLDNSYSEGNMHDVEATFTYPLEESELEKVLEDDSVYDAEGSYVCYEHLTFDGTKYLGRFTSLTERIDVPTSYEGTLPTGKNEVAVEKGAADTLGIEIGDTITLTRDDAETTRIVQCMIDKIPEALSTEEIEELTETEVFYFYQEELTVTAIVVSPNYISTSALSYGMSPKDQTQVSCNFFVAKDAFRDDVVKGYNRFVIQAKSLVGIPTYSEEYPILSEKFTEEITPLLDSIGNERYLTVKNHSSLFCTSLQEQIEKATEDIAQAQQKIDDAQTEIDAKKSEVSSAQSQLSEARSQLDSAPVDLIDAEYQLTIAKQQLDDFEYQVDQINRRIKLVRDRYSHISEEVMLQNEEYAAAIAQRDEAQAALDEATAQYNAKVAELEAAKQTYSEGEVEYAENAQAVASASANISSAETDIEEARQELADAQKSLEVSQSTYNELVREKDKIRDYGTIVIARENNTAYLYNKLLSGIFDKLKYSMGGLFIVVGFMICYSVVTRLVNDQKKLIGTKKALGLSTMEILKPYLIYSGVAFLVGGILGAGLGLHVVEPSILPFSADVYTYDAIMDYYSWKDIAQLFIVEFVLIELVTAFGCLRVIRQPAVNLLNGVNSHTAKIRRYERSKWFLKLPNFTRTIINNCTHDGRRILATIIGISSCVMLLITPITCRNNVLRANHTQFNEYFSFDRFICYDNNVTGAEENIEAVLKEMNVPYSKAFRTYGYISGENMSEKVIALMVYEDYDSFNSMISVKSSVDSNPYNGTGLWIPDSIKQYYDLETQPTVSLRTLEDAEVEIKASGTYNNYMYNLNAFMDAESYKEIYGTDCETNIFIVQTEGCDYEELAARLQEIDGFVLVQDYFYNTKLDAETFTTVANIIVVVYSIMAIVMAFFVLLNLFNTFVEEKKKELIVLMINGFSIHQAKKYIYSDTIVLTIISLIIGTICGIFFGKLSVTSFESEYVFFIRDINYFAIAIGIISTVILTTAMTALALGKIRKFKLEDINRI